MSSDAARMLVAVMDPLHSHCIGVVIAVHSHSLEDRAPRAREILRLEHNLDVDEETMQHIYTKIEMCCPEFLKGDQNSLISCRLFLMFEKCFAQAHRNLKHRCAMWKKCRRAFCGASSATQHCATAVQWRQRGLVQTMTESN